MAGPARTGRTALRAEPVPQGQGNLNVDRARTLWYILEYFGRKRANGQGTKNE